MNNMTEKLVASVIRGNNEYREETYQQLDIKGNIIGIYTKTVPISITPPKTIPKSARKDIFLPSFLSTGMNVLPSIFAAHYTQSSI